MNYYFTFHTQSFPSHLFTLNHFYFLLFTPKINTLYLFFFYIFCYKAQEAAFCLHRLFSIRLAQKLMDINTDRDISNYDKNSVKI